MLGTGYFKWRAEVGLYIHKMIGGELDSGDIITRDYLSIDQNTKISRVWEWMLQRTPNLMLEVINQLAKDKIMSLIINQKILQAL